jgi:hypothetical protein
MADFNKIRFTEKRNIDILIHILNSNWVSDGYNSPYEEKEFKNRAYNMLRNYFYN